MSINVKKYTKDQMAKMVEEAAERLKSQEKENEELAEQLKSQTAKTIALRNKLDDTEAALGRANTLCAQFQSNFTLASETCYNATQRADYAESHPWRNLWAWVKRKIGGERNEHVS